MSRAEKPKTKSESHDATAVKDLLRLHTGLEAHVLMRALRDVCAQRFGARDVRVFVFDGEDHARIREFGDDEGAAETAPVESERVIVWSEADGDSESGQLRTTTTLAIDSEIVGFLRLTADRTLDLEALAFLEVLKQSLAYSLRNSQTLEKTRRLTFTDDLTALYNARFMALYLDREIKRCRRTRSSLSLLFMDLDGFKQVNDVHGHLAGSRTLTEVGAILEKTVRDADVLIRYGGDEFVIVFPETPLSGGMIIAERIRQVIASTSFLAAQGIDARISASIGIASYPETAEDARTLIACADAAMYAAKAQGKNRVISADRIDPKK